MNRECIPPKTPLGIDDAKRLAGEYGGHYNQVRLHSAIGYVAPTNKLLGSEVEIFKERDRKLKSAREKSKQRRRAAAFGLDSLSVAGIR